MTTGDIKLIREFVAATGTWYDLLIFKDKCHCCGTIPDRIIQLSKSLESFLEAYDKKHGKK